MGRLGEKPLLDGRTESPKRDRRTSLGRLAFDELRELRAVVSESLERLDSCIRKVERLQLDSLRMQYRTAGDRVSRDLPNFVRGVEDALAISACEPCTGARIECAPGEDAPQHPKRSASISIGSGLAATALCVVAVIALWVGATLEPWQSGFGTGPRIESGRTAGPAPAASSPSERPPGDRLTDSNFERPAVSLDSPLPADRLGASLAGILSEGLTRRLGGEGIYFRGVVAEETEAAGFPD